MYPPKFDYYRAHSVSEAIGLLQAHQGAKLLAGGHSLLPVMKLRLADPGALIDIGPIAQLQGISRQNGRVRIGALTLHATLEKSALVPKALSQAAGGIGDPMVRNRGTIGGSVAHADPASDLPTVLVALDATFHIAGPAAAGQTGHAQGQTPVKIRSLAANDFFAGFFMTALAEDEILTAVEVPEEKIGQGSAYAKLANPASRFALVGAAASVNMEGGRCVWARVAVGGLTPKATSAPAVEAALVGRVLNAEAIEAASAAVAADLDDEVLSDIHASAAYRRQMAPVLISRAVKQAVQRSGQG